MSPVVYRCLDSEGALLYIGSTGNLRRRMRDHRRHAVWHHLVARIETEAHPSLAEARTAERLAIRSERPSFNKLLVGGGTETKAGGRRKHGTVAAYNKDRCRCDACREAWRLYNAAWLARQRAQQLSPDDPRHGRYTTYFNHACRCEACCHDAAVHRRRYRTARITERAA